MIDEIMEFTTKRSELDLSPIDRVQINHTFQHWFAAVNKRSVPNLDALVKDFQTKMSRLSQTIRFSYEYVGRDLNLTASAPGLDNVTLQQMKAGTLWFNGWKNLEYEVLQVIQD